MQLHRRLIAFLLPCALWAQTVDDRQTVARPGNLHPLARAEYDSGVAPSDYRMERMMLVLEPDAAQQQALQALLAAQQDPQSSEYHQWLTPEQFGERFGVSNHDLGQVLNWLDAEGFQIEPVAAARRTIVFSGTAAQVETAFHTAIHIYDVNGERHYANATDPRIPAALAAVVSGVASLHDFRSSPQHTGARALPDYTSGGTNYMAPADFATIYDVAALYSSSTDGTGQSIAVLGRSNILMPDVTKFRSMFGLSAVNPTVVLNGPNPGIISSSEQTEAELDVEWAGAVAKNAAIQFVLSASTSSSDGILLSGQYAVNHNLAPVISLSFGLCEAALGTAGNQFWNGLWQQAAAQGMTVLVASGDSGAAGCDSPSETKAVSAAGVNGLCSSPYSTCVGGTQFNEAGNASQYWSPSYESHHLGLGVELYPGSGLELQRERKRRFGFVGFGRRREPGLPEARMASRDGRAFRRPSRRAGCGAERVHP
jgi:pseudomonalisin